MELILLAHEVVEAPFVHWITLTVVVIFVRLIRKEQYKKFLRLSLSIFYFAISLVLMIRWKSAGIVLAGLLLEASGRGVIWSNSLVFNIQANLILAIFVLGIALTVWLLNSGNNRLEKDES